MYACPTGAIFRDSSTDAVLVDPGKCVGCRSCIAACPWGLVWMNPEGRIEKCDLCGGKPKCAQWCPTEAIRYVPSDKQHLKKMRRAAIKDVHTVKDKEAILQKIYYSGRDRILSDAKKE
jgi:Fe-S-cluster-containing dehydrogenase component